MPQGRRARYSRWDGSQVGFELDASDIFEEMTDDLLYHGDLNAALRRMLQSGFQDRNGEQLQGIREMLEKLRRSRRERLEQYDLGGVYDDIAQELRDVIDTERGSLDEMADEARESGDQRRQDITEQVVQERQMQLDMLSPDLAGMVRDLQNYEFTSSEAREKFDELLDQLRQQLMQSYVNQMAGAMNDVTPEQMQRMKDMLAELNHMLEQRQQGEEPDFESFMERYGDFFPENPQNLDELLEVMAQRMAAMQSMLNSMTPEQRAQLQGLSEQLLEDMDLRWQVDQLGQNLQSMFPDMGWNRRYDFSGQDPLSFAEAASMLQELGDIDQLENLLRGATSPGALAEVDIDRARELLGDEAARSLEQMSELARKLEEAGLIENKEGRFELTPRGIRRVGQNALNDLFRKLADDKMGRHELQKVGAGHERDYDTKPYEFGDPFNLNIERTDPQRDPAHRWGHPHLALARRLRGRAHRAPGALEHGADARPVVVDAHARQLPAGQEGRHGAPRPDLVAVPTRLPGHRRVQRGGTRAESRAAARGLVGLRLRHQHAARVPDQPPSARPPERHEADHHDHRRRADRPHHVVG